MLLRHGPMRNCNHPSGLKFRALISEDTQHLELTRV